MQNSDGEIEAYVDKHVDKKTADEFKQKIEILLKDKEIQDIKLLDVLVKSY